MLINYKGKYKILYLAFFISVFFLAGVSAAKEAESFSVPPPPEGKLMDTHNMRMGGVDISSFLYISSRDAGDIIDYYKGFFEGKEFEVVLDKVSAGRKLVRFNKEGLIVNISVAPQGDETQVVVAHYSLPQGASPLDEPKPTWQEAISMLPKEDSPGKDLPFIPRPPESVRVLSVDYKNSADLSYISSKPPEEVREFYENQMSSRGWESERELDTEGVISDFKRKASREGQRTDIPMLAGTSLEQLASGGGIMYFKGHGGRAQVSVLKGGSEEIGSLIQIKYVKE
jgi:hypothetical protein